MASRKRPRAPVKPDDGLTAASTPGHDDMSPQTSGVPGQPVADLAKRSYRGVPVEPPFVTHLAPGELQPDRSFRGGLAKVAESLFPGGSARNGAPSLSGPRPAGSGGRSPSGSVTPQSGRPVRSSGEAGFGAPTHRHGPDNVERLEGGVRGSHPSHADTSGLTDDPHSPQHHRLFEHLPRSLAGVSHLNLRERQAEIFARPGCDDLGQNPGNSIAGSSPVTALQARGLDVATVTPDIAIPRAPGEAGTGPGTLSRFHQAPAHYGPPHVAPVSGTESPPDRAR